MADRGRRRARRPGARRRAAGHRHGVHGRGPLPRAAVPGPDRGRDRRRRARRGPRPADRGVRPGAARRPARRPRRSRSSCTPGARTSRCCAASGRTELTNIFDTQVAAGFAGPARPARLRGAAARDGRRAPAQERVVHALGRAPAERRAGRLRARGRPAPAPARRRAAGAACATAAAWTGRARSAARWRTPPTSASSTAIFHRLPRVNSLEPSQRAVAYELVALARGHRARDRPPRAQRRWPTRRWSRSPSAGPQTLERLAQIRGLNEGTLRRRGKAILEAVERGREREPIPVDGRPPARRPTPRTPRSSPSARRSCAPARSEAELAYELHRRARRPAADRHGGPRPPATSPRCARCRAGGARSSATSCSSCCGAGARCASAPAGRSRSRPDSSGTLAPCAVCYRSCSSAH